MAESVDGREAKKHCRGCGEVTEWTIVHAWNACSDRPATSRIPYNLNAFVAAPMVAFRRLVCALALIALPGCAARPEWLDLGAVACAIALPAGAWLAYWRRERRIRRRADEIVRRYWARGMARR